MATATTTAAQTEMQNTDDLIRQKFDALRARKAEIEARSKSLRDNRDALHAQQNAIIEEIQSVTKQIDAIERPDIIDLSEEISRMARVLGGKAMSDTADVTEAV